MKLHNLHALAPLLLLATLACGGAEPALEPSTVETTNSSATVLDPIAEAYVRLVLAVGEHDGGYVDAYYGPEDWRPAADAEKRPLAELRAEAESLLSQLEASTPGDDEQFVLRHRYLVGQLGSVHARIRMLEGERLTFDEESKALYDAIAPTLPAEHFQHGIDELGILLAEQGFTDGSVTERYAAFRADFVVPPERLDDVFRAAVDACRERTAAHLELPEDESFTIEYVTDKSWSGYNWYQGDHRSLIQVNVDLPIYIDRALDLACHEGYPGHHVYNALLEKHLVRDRGWVEFSVYPLYSPQSLIAEGTANFGIELAFPGKERIRFERDVLFPLAGLDPSTAEIYDAARQLAERLGFAGNEAARQYLDGKIDADAAAGWLERYALMSRERAEQRVRFIDTYRAYVINYNLGLELVRRHIDAHAPVGGPSEARWRELGALLASPRLPSGLSIGTEGEASGDVNGDNGEPADSAG